MSLEELAGNENQSGYFFLCWGFQRHRASGEEFQKGRDRIRFISQKVHRWPTGDGMGRTEGARPVQRLRRS